MEYNLPQRVVRDIIIFADKHSIRKVILFGSRARGDNTERSDIDIAVYGGDFDSFYWDIKENKTSLRHIPPQACFISYRLFFSYSNIAIKHHRFRIRQNYLYHRDCDP